MILLYKTNCKRWSNEESLK